MRFIFFLLLLANIALLIWRFTIGLPDRSSAQSHGVSAQSAILQGKSLRLVGEPEDLKFEVSQAGVSRSAPLCKMVGPFEQEQQAENFIERLAVLDVHARVHAMEVSAGPGYWVHFPAEPNRDKARRQLAELQSRGVDSYIIPKGELENGISVGVFSQRGSAQAKLAQLQAMGYKPKVLTIDRSHRELWVLLKEGDEQKIGESTWNTLIHKSFSLQEQENVCLDVASH